MDKKTAPRIIAWLPVPITALAFGLYRLGGLNPKYLWGFNFWDYLPPAISYTLMAFTTLFSFPPLLRSDARLARETTHMALLVARAD